MGGELDFATQAAQAGARIRVGDTIATVGPIAASSTFTYDSVGDVHAALGPQPEGFAYARNANPTAAVLEQVLASLEGAEDAVVFGSGMAAMHAALLGTGIEADDTVVVARDLYGVTRSLLMQLEQFGVSHRFVNVLEPAEVERALGETGARVLCCESISNPLLRVPNLERLVEVAHNYRAAVVLDNTFATPYLLQPLNLGVDVVVHSATKYLAGHGDVMAGYAASNRSRARRMRDVRTVTGAVLSPFEAWLTLRGIKTLPLRMERQCSSALEIATWLDEQGWVSRVYYPGLKSHHQRDVAGRLFGGRYGGMVAFELDAGQESVLRFMDALQVITSATSLGDAMSLILYPKFSSHRTLSDDQLREAGIGGSLLRLSVGLESPRDLTGDLRRAAHAAGISARESAPALPS